MFNKTNNDTDNNMTNYLDTVIETSGLNNKENGRRFNTNAIENETIVKPYKTEFRTVT